MFRVWDMRKLSIVQRHTVAGPVLWTAVSPDGVYTAVGVGTSQVDVFDIRGTTSALHSHKLPKGATVRDGVFQSDGTLLLAGGTAAEHGLRYGGVWPLPNACTSADTKLGDLWVGHSSDALCAAVHRDSGMLALGGADACASLWSAGDQAPTCNVDRSL